MLDKDEYVFSVIPKWVSSLRDILPYRSGLSALCPCVEDFLWIVEALAVRLLAINGFRLYPETVPPGIPDMWALMPFVPSFVDDSHIDLWGSSLVLGLRNSGVLLREVANCANGFYFGDFDKIDDVPDMYDFVRPNNYDSDGFDDDEMYLDVLNRYLGERYGDGAKKYRETWAKWSELEGKGSLDGMHEVGKFVEFADNPYATTNFPSGWMRVPFRALSWNFFLLSKLNSIVWSIGLKNKAERKVEWHYTVSRSWDGSSEDGDSSVSPVIGINTIFQRTAIQWDDYVRVGDFSMTETYERTDSVDIVGDTLKFSTLIGPDYYQRVPDETRERVINTLRGAFDFKLYAVLFQPPVLPGSYDIDIPMAETPLTEHEPRKRLVLLKDVSWNDDGQFTAPSSSLLSAVESFALERSDSEGGVGEMHMGSWSRSERKVGLLRLFAVLTAKEPYRCRGVDSEMMNKVIETVVRSGNQQGGQ